MNLDKKHEKHYTMFAELINDTSPVDNKYLAKFEEFIKLHIDCFIKTELEKTDSHVKCNFNRKANKENCKTKDIENPVVYGEYNYEKNAVVINTGLLSEFSGYTDKLDESKMKKRNETLIELIAATEREYRYSFQIAFESNLEKFCKKIKYKPEAFDKTNNENDTAPKLDEQEIAELLKKDKKLLIYNSLFEPSIRPQLIAGAIKHSLGIKQNPGLETFLEFIEKIDSNHTYTTLKNCNNSSWNAFQEIDAMCSTQITLELLQKYLQERNFDEIGKVTHIGSPTPADTAFKYTSDLLKKLEERANSLESFAQELPKMKEMMNYIRPAAFVAYAKNCYSQESRNEFGTLLAKFSLNAPLRKYLNTPEYMEAVKKELAAAGEQWAVTKIDAVLRNRFLKLKHQEDEGSSI